MTKFAKGHVWFNTLAKKLPGAFYVGLLDGFLRVAGIIIDRDDMDHSRKFPT